MKRVAFRPIRGSAVAGAVAAAIVIAVSLASAGERLSTGGGANGAAPPNVIGLPFLGWTELGPQQVLPTPRRHHASAHDPSRGQVVVVGGNDGALKNDVWALTLAQVPYWTEVFPAGTKPSGRRGHSAIYDPIRDRILVFGGFDNAYRNDTWELSLGSNPTWTLLLPAGTPPPLGRYGHSAIYDPIRDQMIVYGGDYGGASESEDAWALTLGGTPTWSQIVPSGAKPPRRALHVAVYDPAGDRMVVFAGRSGAWNHLNDSWSLSVAGTPAWTQLSPSGGPPIGREAAFAAYDPVEKRMVVFGGWSVSAGNRNDLWALRLPGSPSWAQLSPAGVLPAPRWGDIMQYDPSLDRMVMFGGDGPFRNDLWELQWYVRPGREDGDGDPGKAPEAENRSLLLAIDTPHPNPFALSTTVKFAVPSGGTARLEVFDVTGRLVRTLADGLVSSGTGSVVWDGADDRGRTVPAGIYLFRLSSQSGAATRKVYRM